MDRAQQRTPLCCHSFLRLFFPPPLCAQQQIFRSRGFKRKRKQRNQRTVATERRRRRPRKHSRGRELFEERITDSDILWEGETRSRKDFYMRDEPDCARVDLLYIVGINNKPQIINKVPRYPCHGIRDWTCTKVGTSCEGGRCRDRSNKRQHES